MIKPTIFIGMLALLALAAEPRGDADSQKLARAAEAAWERGDATAAAKLLSQALDRSNDPGWVAFNQGVMHFRNQDWIEAERGFTRSLDDADAAPERRAKAHYNRAVCLLHRGGLAEYRAAIDGFERCLLIVQDAELQQDCRINLELAKVLWAEARTKTKQPPKPNEPVPNAPPEPERKTGPDPSSHGDANDDPSRVGAPKAVDPASQPPKPGTKPKLTEKTVGGKGNLPVRNPGEGWKPASDAEAREYLEQLARRLAQDRRTAAEVHAPPERADVKDW